MARCRTKWMNVFYGTVAYLLAYLPTKYCDNLNKKQSYISMIHTHWVVTQKLEINLQDRVNKIAVEQLPKQTYKADTSLYIYDTIIVHKYIVNKITVPDPSRCHRKMPARPLLSWKLVVCWKAGRVTTRLTVEHDRGCLAEDNLKLTELGQ